MPQPWRERADSPEGEGEIAFAGTTHRAVLGSAEQLLTEGSTPADLLLFRIETDPGVPAPVIASEPPPLSSEVIMIGQGRNRDPEHHGARGPGGGGRLGRRR